MTKKQKNMLTRILVTAVLYAALVAADHMKMIPAVFEGWKLPFRKLFVPLLETAIVKKGTGNCRKGHRKLPKGA